MRMTRQCYLLKALFSKGFAITLNRAYWLNENRKPAKLNCMQLGSLHPFVKSLILHRIFVEEYEAVSKEIWSTQKLTF